jgi:outer membrane murein-binding lipoprotein Lpp
MKRLCLSLVVGLVLAGCDSGEQTEEERKRWEAVKSSQREQEAKTEALSQDVDWLRKRVSEVEKLREATERDLGLARGTLAQSWRGDPAVLKERLASAEVPKALHPWLQKAQEERGNIAPERLFMDAVKGANLDQLAKALDDWELNTGVTALPAEEEPTQEENACTRAEVTFSCTPLALAGPKDDLTQLCRMSQADTVWVLRSNQGSLSRVNLLGSRHDSYRAMRMFSPDVWALVGEDDSPTSPGTSNVSSKAWLEVVKVAPGWDYLRKGARRHAVPLERQGQRLAQAELDLDGDGNDELLVLDGKEVQAVHYERQHDDASLWREADVCPLIEKRTEKELEPARAPCAAWAQAKQPKDGGGP